MAPQRKTKKAILAEKRAARKAEMDRIAKKVVEESRLTILDSLCKLMLEAATGNNGRVPNGYSSAILKECQEDGFAAFVTRDMLNKAYINFKKRRAMTEKIQLQLQLQQQQQQQQKKNLETIPKTIVPCVSIISELTDHNDYGPIVSSFDDDDDEDDNEEYDECPIIIRRQNDPITKAHKPMKTETTRVKKALLQSQDPTIEKKRTKEIEMKVKNSICKKFIKVKQAAKEKNRYVQRGLLSKIIEKEKERFNYTGNISESTIRQRIAR